MNAYGFIALWRAYRLRQLTRAARRDMAEAARLLDRAERLRALAQRYR